MRWVPENRVPLVFFSSAVVWLVLSCLFQQLRALELIFPRFCDNFPLLTFGRVEAAAQACFLYGWGSCVALGCGLLLCGGDQRNVEEICDSTKKGEQRNLGDVCSKKGMQCSCFWNLAVGVGVAMILGGEVVLMPDFPSGLTFFLFLLSLFFCVPVVLRTCSRANEASIARRWLLASSLLLPWLLFTAWTLLGEGVLKGAARLPVAAWFHEGFLWLWLGGSALAFAYFLIPKILNTPLIEQRLASTGFWIFFIVGSWASLRTVAGGPVPAWISALGTSANLLLWVPVVVVGRNLCSTLSRFSLTPEASPALRFTAFGVRAFVLCSIQAIVLYSHSGAVFFQFTDFATAQSILTSYGFLTSIFCGAIYYFAPRILSREWPQPRAIFWHFHLHRLGLAIVVLALTVGGTVQGLLLNNPALPFSASLSAALPWRGVTCAGWGLFFFAQILFALHLLRLLSLRKREIQ